MVIFSKNNGLVRLFNKLMSPSPKHTVSIPLRSAKPMDERPNWSVGHVNFCREADRLRSFENWPVSFMDPSQLASAGFYYLNQNNDTVRCAFCGVEVGCWVRGDDPMFDHRMWSPNCKFVKKLPCGNVPLDPSNETPATTEAGIACHYLDLCAPVASFSTVVPIVDDPMFWKKLWKSLQYQEYRSYFSSWTSGYDTCGNYGIEIRQQANSTNSSSTSNDVPCLEKLSVQMNKQPDFPNYATYEARMKSYRHWPISLKLKPNVLTEAGLFYLGRGDQVMCFHCGLGLKDWEDGDDPWVEHARWSSRCNYVRLIKGKEFIDEVCGKEKQQPVISSEDVKNVIASHSDILSPASSRDVSESSQSSESSKSTVSKSSTEPLKSEASTSETKTSEDRLCKICYTEEMGVAFLPCGHIVACVKCTPSLTTCAVCRTPFLATARVYLS
ncbi:death-associated inhibitor of apoptosis 1 isoform X2 [Bemisia tabaci]|uniref:death-associated inhibitor of apoptosis 1 isoform X2 n=1 Tax=Bemisia tabaci TaxID=7038 RepID=UPI0008F9E417|nr:PREDICTED: death-associated inhibitor of apoptosis 1-like isoform X2 [Bemisia tabaci]